MTERLQLTRDQVVQAETRTGAPHPVVAVIDSYIPRIQLWNATCNALGNANKIDQYIKYHFCSLADAFVKAGPYTLNPVDIIQIWSKIEEITPYGHYTFAEMISAAYAIQGLDNPAWKRFPRYYVEHIESKLPKELVHDETGLTHVRQRLAQVAESISAIESFENSDHGAMSREANEIARKTKSPKTLVEREVIEFARLRKKRSYLDLLHHIGERFGNGLDPLISTIEDAWLELPSSRDKISRIAQALQIAVFQSHQAAIVHVGEVGIHQNDLTNGLPEHYYHVSTKEIFSGHAEIPDDKTALVITGYTRFAGYQKMREEVIQNFVRATAAMRSLHEGNFSIVILSDSLPNENIFGNASLPWFNGPFRREGAVWSIKLQDTGVELTRYKPEVKILGNPPEKILSWVETQRIQV